jgi:hypothetical protein
MANFTYVGEEGAKQLYRHIKRMIPIVDTALDEHSDNPISNSVVTEQLNIINESIASFTSYVVVDPVQDDPDRHPDVPVGSRSTKYIYLVQENEGSATEDTFAEWIWCVPGGQAESYWQKIGTTATQPGAINSWMQWSIDHQSVGDSDSIYIGQRNAAYGHSILFGEDNLTDIDAGAKNHATLVGFGNYSTSDLGSYTAHTLITPDNASDLRDGFWGDFQSILVAARDFLLTTNQYTQEQVNEWYDSQRYEVSNTLFTGDDGYEPYPYLYSEIASYLATDYLGEYSYSQYLCSPTRMMDSETLNSFGYLFYGWDDADETERKTIISTLLDTPELIAYFSNDYVALFEKFVDVGATNLATYEMYLLELVSNMIYYWSPLLENSTFTDATQAKTFFYYAAAIEFFRKSAENYRLDHIVRIPFRKAGVWCNSILMGVGNESYHHNSILLGAYNRSLAPIDSHGKSENTDDDGFGLAIGNCNVVGRNYDIALGFNSMANGGENLAIHHSYAGGYRNVSMMSSYITGTANMGIIESKLNTYGIDETDTYCARNFLVASEVDYDTETDKKSKYAGSSVLTDNMMVGARITFGTTEDGYGAYSRNIVMMSPAGYESYTTSICAPSANDNILIDPLHNTPWDQYSTYPTYIEISNAFDRNTILHARVDAEWFSSVTDNIFINSVNWFWGDDYQDDNSYPPNRTAARNLVIGSIIDAEVYTSYSIDNNVLTQGSMLHVTNNEEIEPSGPSVSKNVLMNGAYLKSSSNETVEAKNGNPYWGNGWDYTKNTVLFGAYGEGLLGCFSHSENADCTSDDWYDSDTRNYIPYIMDSMKLDLPYYLTLDAWMVNSRATVNFGDNFVGDANCSFVTGENNVVNGIDYANIHGNRNLVNNADGGGVARIPHLTISGSENKVYNLYGAYGDEFCGNTIYGRRNYLCGVAIMDSTVTGRENDLSGVDPVRLSVEQIIDYQSRYALSNQSSYPKYFIATETGDVNLYCFGKVNQYDVDGTIYTVKWRVFAGKIYKFIPDYYEFNTKRLNVMPDQRYDVYGEDYNDDGDNMYEYDQAFNDYITAWAENYFSEEPWDYYVYYLPKYRQPDKHIDSDMGYLIDRAFVVGQQNHIGSFNVGHSIFGSNNRIVNTLFDINKSGEPFCLSNSFVQGNDNWAENGSNQVLMGNGIVAYGHNSVAIGTQLVSDQWQTVLGKYNAPKPGPARIKEFYHQEDSYDRSDVVYKQDASGQIGKFYEAQDDIEAGTPWDESLWKEIPSPDRNKALFIIGNGYSERDDLMWQDEQYIKRSNAFTVYADGTVEARRFVSSEDDASLTEGDGISIIEDSNGVTISIKPPTNPERRHVLEWDPVDRKVKWVEVGMYSPE